MFLERQRNTSCKCIIKVLCNDFNTVYTETELNNLPTWKREYIEKNKPIYDKYKIEWDKWYDENREIITKKEIYGYLSTVN